MADLTVFTAFSAATGLPLAGLTPVFLSYINSETGYTADTKPTITPTGDGQYRFDSIPDTHCGMIDNGATASPRYLFVSADTQITIPIFASTGAPDAAATPTWNVYQNVLTGTNITPQATFTNLTGGAYRIDDMDIDTVGIVDTGATSIPRYLSIGQPDPANTIYSANINLPYMTMAQLIDQIRSRCDMQYSEFITDIELSSWINASLTELYDLLVAAYGSDYFVETAEVVTDGTEYVTLPSNCYELLGVDVRVSGGNNGWTTIKNFMRSERNTLSGTGFAGVVGGNWGSNIRYRLNGTKLALDPTPAAGITLRLWIVPAMQSLVLDTDAFNGINGWLDYVIVDCCIKAMVKEESDPSVFNMQKEQLKTRIEGMADNRDAGMPQRVSMTANSGSGWGSTW